MFTLAYKSEQAQRGDLPVVHGPQLDGAFRQREHAKASPRDAQRETWDFAVEIESLLAEGLTRSDLRWLVSKGYLEHADEANAHPGTSGAASDPVRTWRSRSGPVLC